MKPEQTFWNQLKKHLPGFNQRIENAAGAGTPDVYCVWEKSFWIELKVHPNDLSPIQKEWHKRNCLNGGHSFVVSKVGGTEFSVAHILIRKIKVKGNELETPVIGIVKKPFDYSVLVSLIKGGLRG
jgi:hypothetical protein